MPREFDSGEADRVGLELLEWLHKNDIGMASTYGAFLAMAAMIANRLSPGQIKDAENWAERKSNNCLDHLDRKSEPTELS